MTTASDATLLKCIFTKILRDGLDYCSLCFHTSDERRLVEPHYFRLYLETTKIRIGSTPQVVCYICEHRSKRAIEMYQRAKYSAFVRLILAKLLSRRVSEEHIIFDKQYFHNLVKDVHLDTKTFTPHLIESQLQAMRLSVLTQSGVELADSTNVYPCADSIVGMTCRKKIRSTISTVQYQAIAPQHHPTVKVEPTAGSSQLNKTKEFPLPQNSIPAHCTPSDLYVLTRQQTLEPRATPVVPKVITMQDLANQTQDSAAKLVFHSVYVTGDHTYSVPSLSAEIIDKTIYFYDAHRNVISTQSLEMNAIVKNRLVSPLGQKPASLDYHSNVTTDSCQMNVVTADSCHLNVTSDNPPVGGDTPKSDVLVLYNGVAQNKHVMLDGKVIGCCIRGMMPSNTDSGTTETPSKRMKLNTSMKSPRISDIKIMDISSDMDNLQSEKRVTDWEDKIPMDVVCVSFVEPDKAFTQPMLQSTPFAGIQIGEPRSLAGEEHELGVYSDIIDLCET